MRRLIGIAIAVTLIVSLFGTACGSAPPAVPATTEPIKVAVLAPNVGPFIFFWESAKRTTSMLVDKVNAEGGLLGRKLEYVLYDTQAKPDVGKRVAERAIQEDKVVALIGVVVSEVALVVADVAAEHRIPYIIHNPQTLKITEKMQSDPAKYRYMFRTTTNSETIHIPFRPFLTEYLKPKYGIKKVAILYEDVLWTKDVISFDQKVMEAAGLEVKTFPFPLGATVFPELKAAERWGAEAIWWLAGTAAGIPMVKQWATEKIKAHLLGTGFPMVSEPGGWEASEGAVHYATMVGGSAPWGTPITDRLVPWRNQYYQRWGDYKYLQYAPHWYEAWEVLVEGIRKAGSTDAEAIANALEKNETRVLRGKIGFDKNHESKVGRGYASSNPSGEFFGQWQLVEGKPEFVIVWPRELGKPDAWQPAPWIKK